MRVQKLQDLILSIALSIFMVLIYESSAAAGSSGPFHAGMTPEDVAPYCSELSPLGDDPHSYRCLFTDAALDTYGPAPLDIAILSFNQGHLVMSVVRYAPYYSYGPLYRDYILMMTELLKERDLPTAKYCSDIESAIKSPNDPAKEIASGEHYCSLKWEDFSRSDPFAQLALEEMDGAAMIRKIHMYKP